MHRQFADFVSDEVSPAWVSAWRACSWLISILDAGWALRFANIEHEVTGVHRAVRHRHSRPHRSAPLRNRDLSRAGMAMIGAGAQRRSGALAHAASSAILYVMSGQRVGCVAWSPGAV